MKHGPASTRVEAVTTPFSSKMRVMPSFRPRRAWIIARFARGSGSPDLGSGTSALADLTHGRGSWNPWTLRVRSRRRANLLVLTKSRIPSPRCLQLDFDVHAGRDVEPHQRIHGLGGGLQDVDQPLVGAHLELLPRVLVDEWAANHREPLDPGRQRHGAGNHRPRALSGLDDLLRRLVQDLVVERLQADPDALFGHEVA